jgi:WD40 repeat protein
MSDTGLATPLSPYRGLAAFVDSETDALFFFGREREIEIIASNLIAARLTVLYGPSGVGKTSLLRAGVAQRLRSEGAAIAVVSSWSGDPIAGLLAAVEREVRRVAPDVTSPPLGSVGEILSGWTRRLGADLYLVLDQFEEYFLYHGNDEDAGPLGALAEVIRDPGTRVHVVLSIREDALAQLDAFKTQLPGLFGNSLRLDRLDRRAGERAIHGPLERFNELVAADETVQAADDLVAEILDTVEAGRIQLGDTGRGGADDGPPERGRIEAPYLQLVLERLWVVEMERGSRRLQLETLRELGGASRIVEDHLERAMSALTTGEKDAAAAMYNHLVTPSGTKIAHRTGDLARYADVDEDEAQRVLDRLASERIVRTGENGSAGTQYEIFHDVLADAVLAWRNRHENERRLEEERRQAARRHRQTLLLALACGVALTILAGAAVYALTQRSSASGNAKEAKAHDLAALAEAGLLTSPERSLELALEASRTAHTPTVEDALRRTLRALRVTAVLRGPGPITHVAVTPEGSRLAMFVLGRQGRLFDAAGKRQISFLRNAMDGGSFSPDGTRMVTPGRDGWARVWGVRTGKQVLGLRHSGLTDAVFAPSSALIATAGPNGRVRIWDSRTGRLLQALGHPGRLQRTFGNQTPMASISFSGDGRLLVLTAEDHAGSRVQSSRVFDVHNGRLVATLRHPGGTRGARFAPRGELVMTWGSRDHVARLWDGRTGKLRAELRGHERGVLDAAWSRDGKLVATGSADGTARVWDTSDGRLVAILPGHSNWVTGLEFSPDDELIVTGSKDHLARVFDANSGTLRATLAGHSEGITDVAFGRRGRTVVTSSSDGTVRVWDARPFPELSLVRHASREPIRGVAFTPAGRIVSSDVGEVSKDGRYVASRSTKDVIRITDTTSGRVLRTLRNPEVSAMAFSPTGDRLLAWSRDGTGRVWRLDDGRVEHTIRGFPAKTVALSANGRRAFAVLSAGQVGAAAPVIWNTETGRPIRQLRAISTAQLSSASFSHDGRFLVTTGDDREARLFDVETGKQVWVLSHASKISGAKFSADGNWVVIAGPGYAGIVDAHTGERILLINGHDRLLTAAAFSPTGWRIATGSDSGAVKTYDCRVCGGIDELVKLAEQRLAQLRSTS